METQASVEQPPSEADTEGIEVRVGVMEGDEVKVEEETMVTTIPVEVEQIISIIGERVPDNEELVCVTDAMAQPLEFFVFTTKKTVRKSHRKCSNKRQMMWKIMCQSTKARSLLHGRQSHDFRPGTAVS